MNILQEYMPSQTLETLYKKGFREYGRLSEMIVAKYTESILHGMEYLHQNDVVHSSIKAANVFVNNYGSCKLADFGKVRQICQASTSK